MIDHTTGDQAGVRARIATVFDLDARLPGKVLRALADEAVRADWCARYGPCLDAAGVVDSWLEPVFRGPVPAPYAAELTANYGAPQSR